MDLLRVGVDGKLEILLWYERDDVSQNTAKGKGLWTRTEHTHLICSFLGDLGLIKPR